MVLRVVEGTIQSQGTVSGTDATTVGLTEETHAIRIFLENPLLAPNFEQTVINTTASGAGVTIQGVGETSVTTSEDIITISGTDHATNTDTISNALVGSDGITVTSGASQDTITGFRTEFVNASGTLSTEIDSDISTHTANTAAHHTRYFSTENEAIVGVGEVVVTSGGGIITVSGTPHVSTFNLTVKETDGSPSVSSVDTIVVTTGTLTDDGGGQVTIDTGGAGGGAGNINSINAQTGPDVTITGVGIVNTLTAGNVITISGTQDAFAAVQARRTTTYTITTSFADVTFDVTDEETDATAIEHNNTNTDDIDIKVDGSYLIRYEVDTDAQAGLDRNSLIEGRVRLNDTTVLNGSHARVATFNDGSIPGTEGPQHLSNAFIATLSANDKVTFQLQKTDLGSAAGLTTDPDITFQVIKLDGVPGSIGATGLTGSTGPTGPQGIQGFPGAPDSALIGVGDITVISGTNTITISGAGGAGSEVTSLNSLTGDVTLIGKEGIGISEEGQNIVVSGTNLLEFAFTKSDAGYTNSVDTFYKILAAFIFPGTNVVGTPTKIKISHRQDGTNTGAVKIFDVTNGFTIVEKTGLSETSTTITNLGTLSNLPTTEAVFEMQVKIDTGSGKNRVSSLKFEFQEVTWSTKYD